VSSPSAPHTSTKAGCGVGGGGETGRGLTVTSYQVAEIPAKKLKRGRRKKKLAERICSLILAEFYQKVAEKGPQKIFKRSSLFLDMITTYNVHQDEIKFDFLEIGRTFS
jgi:hypothetical protein